MKRQSMEEYVQEMIKRRERENAGKNLNGKSNEND